MISEDVMLLVSVLAICVGFLMGRVSR